MNHNHHPSEELFYLRGGTPLQGDITVNTAKNATLPLMLTCLLTRDAITLEQVPRLSDVIALTGLLEHFGVTTHWQDRDLTLHAQHIHTCAAPYTLVSKLRASFVAMGALLGRCGEARISMPGGCAFGPRPVDRHIKAFRQLGMQLSEEGGDFYAKRPDKMHERVVFEAPTVGGTQNVLLACVLGDTQVVIENAALEPEITDLVNMLNAMGARITGAGGPTLYVEGVPELYGLRYRPIADRIETGTLMLATAATRGHVTLHQVNPEHLRALTTKLAETGVRITTVGPNTLTVDATGPLTPTDIVAVEYPGFPTDLQAPFGAFAATVPGLSVITDRVYPDRYTHVDELKRTGAQLEMRERVLLVRGGPLQGAEMHAADIRAGGALVIAALAASGSSVISGVKYIKRGYEELPERLRQLGADIYDTPAVTGLPFA